jgi:hypothetical protein
VTCPALECMPIWLSTRVRANRAIGKQGEIAARCSQLDNQMGEHLAGFAEAEIPHDLREFVLQPVVLRALPSAVTRQGLPMIAQPGVA